MIIMDVLAYGKFQQVSGKFFHNPTKYFGLMISLACMLSPALELHVNGVCKAIIFFTSFFTIFSNIRTTKISSNTLDTLRSVFQAVIFTERHD